MTISKGFLAVWASVIALGCAAPAAMPPVFPDTFDARTRDRLYERYRLEGDVSTFSASWRRSDGKYEWSQLEGLASAFPETDELYDDVNARNTSLLLLGAVGGGTIGGTLGYNLVAPKDQRMTEGAQAALYLTGGGIIVASLIAEAIWHNPARDFADTYNRALRRELGVKEPVRRVSAEGWRRPSNPDHAGPGGFEIRF